MRKIILILIILLAIRINTYSQMIVQCTTGVSTLLTSSSNGQPGSLVWQGWACGINGVIIRSYPNSPGGTQWINCTNHGVPSNINLVNICGVSGQIAFVTGSNASGAYVWKTTNAGANFFQVFFQPNGFVNSVWMRNELRGFMQGNPVGGRWSLWKTTNGGLNWDSTGLYLPRAGSENGFPNSLVIPFWVQQPQDTNKIWFGTNNSRIYYSSNYGQNWIVQNTSPRQNINCINFGIVYGGITEVALYAAADSILLKSTNFGINWTSVNVPGTGIITGVTLCWFGYYLTRGNKIYGRDYNEIWNLKYTSPSGVYTYVDNRGFGGWFDHYFVKNNGGITFVTEGEEVKKISSNTPVSFSLYDNYPNPFNPSTTIEFDIPRKEIASLSLYDLTGRLIEVLHNGIVSPGRYSVSWDGSNYSSGIYFYTLKTESFTQTKRMVLVK